MTLRAIAGVFVAVLASSSADARGLGPALPTTPAMARESAKLYDGAVSSDHLVGTVVVADLVEAMQSATWTDERLMRKGAWIVELSSGARVCVYYAGYFFAGRGTPGYFVVLEAQQAAFRDIVEKRLSEPTIEWRVRRNAAKLPPPSGGAAGQGCSNA